MLKIYKTYALPVIDYSDVLYHGANADLLLGLQRIQNRCLKYCLKLPVLTSTDYIHQETDIPMLHERRLYHARILGFKKSRLPSFCVYKQWSEHEHIRPLFKILVWFMLPHTRDP